jgi:hypothetical protein
MQLGQEVDERAAVDEVDQLVEAGTGAGLLALAQPAPRDRVVELVVVVDAAGHPVAANEHVEPEIDGEHRVAVANQVGLWLRTTDGDHDGGTPCWIDSIRAG